MEQKPTYEELEKRITELEKEALELRQIERDLKIFETSVESSLNAIGLTDLQGKLIYVNNSCVKMWGYNSRDQMLGRSLSEFWEGDGIFRTLKELHEKGAAEGEDVGKRKDGSLFYVKFTASMLRDEDGNPSFMFGSFFDITKRKRFEEGLRNSEERYRMLITKMSNGFALHEIIYDGAGKPCDYRFIEINSAFEEMTGLKTEEVVEKTALEVLPKIEKSWIDTYGRVALTGEPVHFEEYSQKFDKYFEVLAYSPKKGQFATVFTDITGRRKAEETLKFTQFAIERSSEAAFWMGSDAGFIYVNEAACHNLGYSRDELLKMTVHDIDPNFPKEIWSEHWADLKRKGSFVLESHHRTKDGRIFPVELSVNYLKFGGKEYNCAFARDITERKKTEEAIKLSRREWVSTFDAMSDWVSLIDPKYRILRSNRSGEKFLGLPTEEIIGRICCELVHGTEEPIADCPMQKMLQTRQRETIDFYAREMNRWMRITVDPVIDEDDNIVKVIHIVRDITEFKKIEDERLKSMKLESVGILAGGIAHDFNNLLSVIIGNIFLIEDDVKPEICISENIKEVEKACLQAKDLTKQLITFSKGGLPVKKKEPIGDLIRESIKLILSDSNVKCNFFIPHDLWLIDFDKDQIKHVIRNLIINAVESMPNGGSINTKAENASISSDTIGKGLTLPPGEYVKISIRDQGSGIPAEHLSLIFDPYFSTKEMGPDKGMGLGLATAYAIINKHNGHLSVESEEGVGTTFIIYLPVCEKEIDELEPTEKILPEKPAMRTGRILLMDDEEMIRNLVEKMLSKLGYVTELAKDGTEAIELFKIAIDSGKPYDAVILDLTVKKGMGGKDAVTKLLEIDPQVKAIASSGYSNDPVMPDFRRYGFIGALPKPYTMKNMSEALSKATMEIS
jgi:PAS domain S-box-containing protein